MNIIPQIGDVVFKRGSAVSRWGQQASRWKEARFGHVMLSLGGAVLIESMPGPGVQIVSISALAGDVWVAVRSKELSRLLDSDTAFYREIHDAVLFNYRRMYNSLLSSKNSRLVPRRFRQGAFCSELIAIVYSRLATRYPSLSLPIDRVPETVLPVDLEVLLSHESWTEITPCFQTILLSESVLSRQDSEALRVMWDLQLHSALAADRAGLSIAETEATLVKIAELAKRGENIDAMLGATKSLFEYWTSVFDIVRDPMSVARPNPLLALPPISFAQVPRVPRPNPEFVELLLDSPIKLLDVEAGWLEALLKGTQGIAVALLTGSQLEEDAKARMVPTLERMHDLVEAIQNWPNYREDLHRLLVEFESPARAVESDAARLFQNRAIEFLTLRLRIVTEGWDRQLKEIIDTLGAGDYHAVIKAFARFQENILGRPNTPSARGDG